MHHDSLDPREDAARESAAESRPAQQAEPLAADREVTPPSSEIPSAVHAFLDGDVVSEQALSASQRELELWKRIGAETGRRRRMMTPAHLSSQILAKLADD
jgi:hypothetical protein